VKNADLPFYFKDGNIVWLRKFSNKINSTYLFYWLNSEYGRRKVLDTAIGSTQAALTITGLETISISWPSLAHQTGIVKVLSAIDEKIALNDSLSKSLEVIAQTIFKSWFIDFDPVKAKMAGEKPAGMDDATVALFPDSMEESELGLVPKGWEISNVGIFCPFKYGRALPSDKRVVGDISVYGSNGVVGRHNEALTSENSIVIGRKGTVGKVFLEPAPCWVIDTAFYANTLDSKDIYLAYLLLQNLGLEEMNSDGAVPGLNRENAHRLMFTIGTSKLRDMFAKYSDEIFLQIGNLQAQASSLIAMRDSLLPRLISGELQIPDEMLAS
jgi:type I restriction enzyme S subunit